VARFGGAWVDERRAGDTVSVRLRPLAEYRVNHPNFGWSLTAEDIAAVRGARFFEVYNGHPLVNNRGDALRAGTERIWDVALTLRLSQGGDVLYGLATDDAHYYHETGPRAPNPGRGWVMVRADRLAPEALVAAMERGDFYASSGVAITEVRRKRGRIALRIRPERGVTYTTHFIGTRRGYDPASEPVRDSAGRDLTRRYAPEVGAILATVPGTTPSYELAGDELYVRATVVSSKRKDNPVVAGEVERAWVQPLVPPRADRSARSP
jgi:hypothetical protein